MPVTPNRRRKYGQLTGVSYFKRSKMSWILRYPITFMYPPRKKKLSVIIKMSHF